MPTDYFTIERPDSEPYTVELVVTASYCTSDGTVIGAIEDTHPNLTITFEIDYQDIDFDTTNFPYQYTDADHHYIASSYDIIAYKYLPYVQAKPNDSNNPQLLLLPYPIPIEITTDIPCPYSYSYLTYNDNGTLYYDTLTVDLENYFSVGDTFKMNGVWYKVNSLATGYYAYPVKGLI